MKKHIKTLAIVGLTAMMSVAVSVTAFAGEWKKNDTGWWWQNEDGSYPVNSWQWLDGNKDGIAECYYFDANGYMLANTVIGSDAVNADGAWVVNGVVQTQPVKASENNAPQGNTGNADTATETKGTTETKDTTQSTAFEEWKKDFKNKWKSAYETANDEAIKANLNTVEPLKYTFETTNPSELTEEILHELCVECAQVCLPRNYYYWYYYNGNGNSLTIKVVSSATPIPESMKN